MTRRRSLTLATVTAAVLVIAASALAGCGRNGPPELPSEQVAAKPLGNDIVPGANRHMMAVNTGPALMSSDAAPALT